MTTLSPHFCLGTPIRFQSPNLYPCLRSRKLLCVSQVSTSRRPNRRFLFLLLYSHGNYFTLMVTSFTFDSNSHPSSSPEPRPHPLGKYPSDLKFLFFKLIDLSGSMTREKVLDSSSREEYRLRSRTDSSKLENAKNGNFRYRFWS